MNPTTDWAIADAFRCLENGDLDGFFEHFDDDVEWTVMGSHPLAGTYRGKEALRGGPFLPLNRDIEEGAEVRVRHQLICGRRAVIEAETVPSDYLRKTAPYRYCWVLELEEGRIVRGRAYVDAALILKMLS